MLSLHLWFLLITLRTHNNRNLVLNDQDFHCQKKKKYQLDSILKHKAPLKYSSTVKKKIVKLCVILII